MKLAIMQPYVFPYIGYFQLINAVDVFIFYDDVNFIKGGWIHRNKLLVNNSEYLFTVPLLKPSSFRKLTEIEINPKIYISWRHNFFKTLQQSYSKAPYYNEVLPLIERVLKNHISANIGKIAARSVMEVCEYLEIKNQLFFSSERFAASQNKGRTERLIYIAKLLEADTYINAIGGKKLYRNEDFNKEGIKLEFIKTGEIEYTQYSNEFVPNLSIIDVMMFNSKEQIQIMLNRYELI
ncbi:MULTISPECIES: WbqC family protein [Aequorivita]|uniref:WbqC family protein n=1 Tax=Aequorivita iocasae TaxID=2803865 RepID=A0ABX7DTG4_9FLAO|nr:MULTISPECIES: WbqC family protein [Aequorivita]QQX76802.1 WbqC family protein [Aequorivita iocasae]UCA56274.1 WbqC family protein [Aequorivita sp. F7]